MLVCVKMISSWVRKVLYMAKAHMYLGAFAGAVSLASILQAGDWARVSMPARYYFSMYITTTNLHHDSVQHDVLGLSE